MNLDEIEDLTEEAIVKMLKQCGGAHQPQSYEFN
jgi:hypothetical protein